MNNKTDIIIIRIRIKILKGNELRLSPAIHNMDFMSNIKTAMSYNEVNK